MNTIDNTLLLAEGNPDKMGYHAQEKIGELKDNLNYKK